MQVRAGLACLALLLLGAKDPDPLAIDPSTLRVYLMKDHYVDDGPDRLLGDWEHDLKAALRVAELDPAADSIAGRYGLTAEQMRRLSRLWLATEFNGFRLRDDAKAFPVLENGFLDLLAETGRAPLVLRAAAKALDDSLICERDAFDRLMARSTDRAADAWTIASITRCSRDYSEFLRIDPVHPLAALISIGDLDWIGPEALHSLQSILIRPEYLERIEAGGRLAVSARLHRSYFETLFDIGLGERALAQFDALPAPLREAIVADDPQIVVRADGYGLLLAGDSNDWFRVKLAAVLAVADRKTEAEAVLARVTTLADARRSLACVDEPPPTRDRWCSENHDPNAVALILDRYLHQPGEDPYPLAESLVALNIDTYVGSGSVGALTCRLFADPQFSAFCESVKKQTVRAAVGGRYGASDDSLARMIAVIESARLPDWPETLARTRSLLAKVMRSTGSDPDRKREPPHRESVVSQPPPFVRRELPQAYRGSHDPRPWPADVSPLPDGYQPLRFERSGRRAVAISESQRLDPSGEVTAGGYWVHLSTDGGRKWQRPLYTGLAEGFPYVVRAGSTLPLLEGDMLRLDVEIAEIDTATIIYPPIATRTRRRESDLYLEIPLAELTRDSDGDGITDLAAHHLLLDRPSADGTPFVVGSDPPGRCTAPPDDVKLARIAMISQLFNIGSRALIAPADHKPNLSLRGWRRIPAGAGQPVFVRGDPADYACIRPERMMIVYTDADLERMKPLTPDFHAVAMPRIVFNRAHDRGYVRWSAGWVGGTYRLRLIDGKWMFETISSWIS